MSMPENRLEHHSREILTDLDLARDLIRGARALSTGGADLDVAVRELLEQASARITAASCAIEDVETVAHSQAAKHISREAR